MLLEHLFRGDLDDFADQVVSAYGEALQFATAIERDSVCTQLRLILKTAETPPSALSDVIARICLQPGEQPRRVKRKASHTRTPRKPRKGSP